VRSFGADRFHKPTVDLARWMVAILKCLVFCTYDRTDLKEQICVGLWVWVTNVDRPVESISFQVNMCG
jgi:hypothetical protein